MFGTEKDVIILDDDENEICSKAAGKNYPPYSQWRADFCQ